VLQQIYTAQFKKDLSKSIKRGKNPAKLDALIKLLVSNTTLPKKCKDHPLTGNYKGRRDCHIEPNWLLIYKKEKTQIIFERIGTHSDLFR
jgi:mRNA interferase YafQ